MKSVVVQPMPEPADELKRVSIGEAANSDYIFYITKGNDIMLLCPISDTCSDVSNGMGYGFRSSNVLLSKQVDCRYGGGNKGITFQGQSEQKAILNAIMAGRTVYTADYMNEAFDIYVSVRKERGNI